MKSALSSFRRKTVLVSGTILICIAGGVAADYWSAVPPEHEATFVGRQACVDCHREQSHAFHGSHHDLAMDRATEETVLGNFNDVRFTHHGVESRFYRDGDRFMVRTEGESGVLEDFEVKYVFGVDPLQQYMVEFDRDPEMAEDEVARVQVLRLCWDTHRGQWFYLAPPDVDEKLQPDDPLHWTGIAQRWQTMCADCHSTNLQRNFDPKTNQYRTTFSEIDVSCEACHGPGSLHVELANSRSLFWDRHHGYALAKLKGDDPTGQLESCAPCHSRRGVLDGSYHAGDRFHDHFDLEVLGRDTYHADGQIKDEVYVYGSFIQSKMYHKSIRCTDCHDPHSLKLKHPGNETCTSCHQHAAGKYDVPSHHHHEPGTAGAMCVNCHMPHTTYMDVDPRRDHSLRVPRPDLSVKLGTPNACSGCHVQDHRDRIAEQTDAEQRYDLSQYAQWQLAADEGEEEVAEVLAEVDRWCDEACEKWYGVNRQQPVHYAEAIQAFRQGDDGSVKGLLRLAAANPTQDAARPEIARATALNELAGVSPGHPQHSAVIRLAAELAGDVNEGSLVRSAAINTLQTASPRKIRKTLMPLLTDDSRQVRVRATQAIIRFEAYPTLTASEKSQVDLSLREVKQSIMVADDRAGAFMNWANLCEGVGDLEKAVNAYQTAIRLEPSMVGPRANLAELMEGMANRLPRPTAEQYLQYAATLREQELPLRIRDANLAPEIAMVQYQCASALYLAGRRDEAIEYLERAVELEPDVPLFQTFLEGLRDQAANSE